MNVKKKHMFKNHEEKRRQDLALFTQKGARAF